GRGYEPRDGDPKWVRRRPESLSRLSRLLEGHVPAQAGPDRDVHNQQRREYADDPISRQSSRLGPDDPTKLADVFAGHDGVGRARNLRADARADPVRFRGRVYGFEHGEPVLRVPQEWDDPMRSHPVKAACRGVHWRAILFLIGAVPILSAACGVVAGS